MILKCTSLIILLRRELLHVYSPFFSSTGKLLHPSGALYEVLLALYILLEYILRKHALKTEL